MPEKLNYLFVDISVDDIMLRYETRAKNMSKQNVLLAIEKILYKGVFRKKEKHLDLSEKLKDARGQVRRADQ